MPLYPFGDDATHPRLGFPLSNRIFGRTFFLSSERPKKIKASSFFAVEPLEVE
jgi:hypothetical protein